MEHHTVQFYLFWGIGILGFLLALGMFITIFYLVFYNTIDNQVHNIKYQKVSQHEEKQD